MLKRYMQKTMTTKNSSNFLLHLLILFSFANCTTSTSKDDQDSTYKKLTKQKIIIQGELDTLVALYPFTLTSKFKTEEITFNSIHFRFEFEEDVPILVNLASYSSVSIPIFAMPGDSIHLALKSSDLLNDLITPIFSGSSTEENKRLSQCNKLFFAGKKSRNTLYRLNESSFLKQLDSLENIGLNIKGAIQNPYFHKYFDTFLKYKLGETLEDHPMVSRAAFNRKEINLPQAYLAKYKTLFEENSNAFHIYPYVEYLNRQVDRKVGIGSVPSVKFQMIDSLYMNKEVNEFCKYHVIRREIESTALIKKLNFSRKDISDAPVIGRTQFDYLGELNTKIEFYRRTNPVPMFMGQVEEAYKKLTD